MSSLTETERLILANWLGTRDVLRVALEKFCQAKREEEERTTSDEVRTASMTLNTLRSVLAHSAKSEVYQQFFADLERFLSK